MRKKLKIKRRFDRERKLPQESTSNLIYGTWLIAGGVSATIYFCFDIFKRKFNLLMVAALILSIISAVTGYYLIEKANRGQRD